jgi:hypothetical protein
MKLIRPALTSIVLSITASLLASWLLRRAMHVDQQGDADASGDNPRGPVVLVPVIVVIGNTVGSPVIVPRGRRGLPFRGGKHKHH